LYGENVEQTKRASRLEGEEEEKGKKNGIKSRYSSLSKVVSPTLGCVVLEKRSTHSLLLFLFVENNLPNILSLFEGFLLPELEISSLSLSSLPLSLFLLYPCTIKFERGESVE